MPDEPVDLGQRDAGLRPVRVEQAQLDTFGDLTEQCEIRPRPVVRRAQGVGTSRPDFHVTPKCKRRLCVAPTLPEPCRVPAAYPFRAPAIPGCGAFAQRLGARPAPGASGRRRRRPARWRGRLRRRATSRRRSGWWVRTAPARRRPCSPASCANCASTNSHMLASTPASTPVMPTAATAPAVTTRSGEARTGRGGGQEQDEDGQQAGADDQGNPESAQVVSRRCDGVRVQVEAAPAVHRELQGLAGARLADDHELLEGGEHRQRCGGGQQNDARPRGCGPASPSATGRDRSPRRPRGRGCVSDLRDRRTRPPPSAKSVRIRRATVTRLSYPARTVEACAFVPTSFPAPASSRWFPTSSPPATSRPRSRNSSGASGPARRTSSCSARPAPASRPPRPGSSSGCSARRW